MILILLLDFARASGVGCQGIALNMIRRTLSARPVFRRSRTDVGPSGWPNFSIDSPNKKPRPVAHVAHLALPHPFVSSDLGVAANFLFLKVSKDLH